MKLLLVLDHPYTISSAANVLHRRSLSAAIAAAALRGAASAGIETDLIDLAADGFQPAMTRDDLAAWRRGSVADPQVRDYQRRLFEADHLAFVFPLWWEAMPAATKGFLDRVLTKGIVFEELPGGKGNPFRNHLDRLATVSVLSIMTTPDKAYRWWYRDPLTKIMFRGTFGKIGIRDLRWVNYADVAGRTDAERQEMIDATERRFARPAGRIGRTGLRRITGQAGGDKMSARS